MNHVQMNYTYLSKKTNATINGEKLSPYSELSTTLSRAFLDAFPNILSGLDKEIFDDYQIDFYGDLYSYKLLLSTSNTSEFCKRINFHEMESLYDSKELLEKLSNIGEQNNIFIKKPGNITIYNSTSLTVPQNDYLTLVDRPNADIGIFTDINGIPSTVRIPVIISDNISHHYSDGRMYYFIPQKELTLFWNYVILEFITRTLVEQYITTLKYVKLNALQKSELEAIENNTAGYYMGEIPSILEKGTSFSMEFSSFPSSAFMLKSEDNSIISCTADKITAQKSGSTYISVVNANDEIVVQKQISVIEHQYVEDIRLIPRFKYLKPSERNHIDVIVTPLNAEDANHLTWTVSDPRIIQVNENGNIIALENGNATITVSGHVTSAALKVEVKPTLQNLNFSQQSIRLKTGESFILECNISPSDAPTENLTWELDNQMIASINPSKTGTKCQITASKSYEGKGNVRCYDSNMKLGAICNIEVISKVKPSTAGKIALWCWIIGIVLPFLLPVSTIAGLYGLANDSEPDRKSKYIVCTVGSILTLLFYIMLS